MDTFSWIRHRFEVEIPRGKFIKISSILKGESTWKLLHRFFIDSYNDNFKDNFVRQKVNKMASKAKTLNICAVKPNWKWIHDEPVKPYKIIPKMQFQILINIGRITSIIGIICVFSPPLRFGTFSSCFWMTSFT